MEFGKFTSRAEANKYKREVVRANPKRKGKVKVETRYVLRFVK